MHNLGARVKRARLWSWVGRRAAAASLGPPLRASGRGRHLRVPRAPIHTHLGSFFFCGVARKYS